MKDVATSRRFILEALQEAGMLSLDRHKGECYLMHLGASHDMETCLTVEKLLHNKEEQHVCMQLANKEIPTKPKPLVIHFTRDAASHKP